jgi:hypothetical protein
MAPASWRANGRKTPRRTNVPDAGKKNSTPSPPKSDRHENCRNASTPNAATGKGKTLERGGPER